MNKIRVQNHKELLDIFKNSWGSFYLVYDKIHDDSYRRAIGELESDERFYEINIDEIPPEFRGFLLERALFDLTKEKPIRTIPYLGSFVKNMGFIDSCEDIAGVSRVVDRMRKEKIGVISFYSKLEGR